MTITMYDACTAGNIPFATEAAACYVNGGCSNEAAVRARRPKYLLTISTNAGGDADCLDVESGDATPDQAAGWVARQFARGVYRPCVYGTESSWDGSMLHDLSGFGDRIRRWVAAWDNSATVPAGYDAHQYRGGVHEPFDVSVCLPNFFDPPQPTDPHHYEWFSVGPFPSQWGKIDERQIVLDYDGARQHPIRYFLYLRKLRAQLKFLADRVWTVAHQQLVDGKPSWGLFYRGWRYQELLKRSQGQRLV